MSEPDWRKMGDPLNDRLPPRDPVRYNDEARQRWREAGAANFPASDDYHPNEWDKGQMIEAMWAEIDTLRSALRYLNEWCPSVAPRQAEIDRLLTAPRLPMRSLLQLRVRLEVGPVVDRVGEINIAHGERDDGSGACLCGRESYLACPYWPEGGVAGLTWSATPSMPSSPTPPPTCEQ